MLAGARYTLLVFTDGQLPERVFNASVTAVERKILRERTSLEKTLFNIFSTRFYIGKYESTPNKTHCEHLLDRDLLESAIENYWAESDTLRYELILPTT